MVILDRLFELVVFTLIFILAIIYIINTVIVDGTLLTILKWSLAIFIFLILILLAAVTPRVSRKIFYKLLPFKKHLFLKSILEFMQNKARTFYASMEFFKNKKIYKFMIPLTLAGWIFEFLSFYFVFSSVMPIPFFKIASAQILDIAATLIAFIPGGLGMGETGVIYIVNLYDYRVVSITAAVLLVRLILTGTLITTGIIGSFLLKEKRGCCAGIIRSK